MRIGDIEVAAVSDGEGKLAATYIPKIDWDAHAQLLDADGNFDIALGCFLIRTGAHTVLVDAGLGPVTFPPFRGGDLPGNLAAAGVRPEDIDVVCITHLHVDHIGWLVRDGAPYFPNAVVRFGAKDLDQFVHADQPDPFAPPIVNVLADTGRIETVAGRTTVAPGVDMIDTPGHTLGHMSVVVSSGAERAFMLGDAVACPLQLEDAEWAAMSDVDPELSSRSRDALYRELEATGDLMVAAHFPELQFGRVLRGEGRRYFS
jgi:glyoxylase-like metal-dependent hydrolase (beta-lactamase superfamily II)